MTYGRGVIEKLPSGRYRLRVPDGRGGYKPGGTYDTKEEAKRMRAAAQVVRSESSIAQSVAEYGELVIMRWKAEGKRSWKSDHSRWKCWVCKVSEFAGDPVDVVARGDVKRFARELLKCDSERARPIANQTIKHVVNLVRRVFHEAVHTDELIERSPVEGVEVPQRNDATEDHWTALTLEEIEQIRSCELLSFEQRTVFQFAVYTGLRQGEIAALQWPDVVDLDGEAPHIWVRRSWNTTTKTGKARRVELIRPAVELLQAWRAHMTNSPHKNIWGHIYARGYDWGWALKKDYQRGVCWIGAKRQAGIVRSVWFHHLRDTCASHLLTGSWGRAWTIAEVSQLLGHSDTWVTQRYARILPGALAKAAAATTGATSHEPTTVISAKAAQVVDFIGRAMGDSNARLLAPEAQQSGLIPQGYAARGSSVEGLAREFLRIAALGCGGSEEAASAVMLASAVLGAPEIALAIRVVDGGPDARVAAIELAGAVLRRLQVLEQKREA